MATKVKKISDIEVMNMYYRGMLALTVLAGIVSVCAGVFTSASPVFVSKVFQSKTSLFALFGVIEAFFFAVLMNRRRSSETLPIIISIVLLFLYATFCGSAFVLAVGGNTADAAGFQMFVVIAVLFIATASAALGIVCSTKEEEEEEGDAKVRNVNNFLAAGVCTGLLCVVANIFFDIPAVNHAANIILMSIVITLLASDVQTLVQFRCVPKDAKKYVYFPVVVHHLCFGMAIIQAVFM